MRSKRVKFLFCYLLIAVSIVFTACSQEKKTVTTDSFDGVNKNGYTQAESVLCSTKQKLADMKISHSSTVYNDFYKYRLFGFLRGSESCALTRNYTKNSMGESSYSVELRTNCIENGSFWEIKTIARENNVATIVLVEFNSKTTPAREIKITSGYLVTLQNLFDEIGLHFLDCVEDIT